VKHAKTRRNGWKGVSACRFSSSFTNHPFDLPVGIFCLWAHDRTIIEGGTTTTCETQSLVSGISRVPKMSVHESGPKRTRTSAAGKDLERLGERGVHREHHRASRVGVRATYRGL